MQNENDTSKPKTSPQQRTGVGCHPTTCCASFWRAGWERKLNEMVAAHIAAGKHIGGSIENFECGQVAVRTGMAVCRHRQEIAKFRHNTPEKTLKCTGRTIAELHPNPPTSEKI
jgi:hypothetical protein